MTTAEQVTALGQYYQNLLIMQYNNKPKASATVNAIATQICCDLIWIAVRDGFSVDTAVGPQLDILGKYLGIERDMVAGQLLTDDDMRFLIKLRIIRNNTDNTLMDIDNLMFQFFGFDIRIVDNKDFTMTYIYGTSKIALFNLAVKTNSLPKPMGVGIILQNVPDDKIFGFGRYDGFVAPKIHGFGSYADETNGGLFVRY